MRTTLLIVLLAASVGAGAFEIGPELHGAADLDSGEGFQPLKGNSSVFFEPGAEPFAQEVSVHLQAAMDRVTAAHGRAFLGPVEVYVCATLRSFVRLSPTALAVTRRERIFLSPRLFLDRTRVPSVLTHELAHVHFAQHAGTESVAHNIPAWFREGYAVQVAAGGLERVSRQAAAGAIIAGDAFVPTARQDGYLAGTASKFGIDLPMFYRQADMFVGYLESRSPERFRALVSSLLDGLAFEEAFARTFEHPPEEIWSEFVADLKKGLL